MTIRLLGGTFIAQAEPVSRSLTISHSVRVRSQRPS